jgi:hypothetical protein
VFSLQLRRCVFVILTAPGARPSPGYSELRMGVFFFSFVKFGT